MSGKRKHGSFAVYKQLSSGNSDLPRNDNSGESRRILVYTERVVTLSTKGCGKGSRGQRGETSPPKGIRGGVYCRRVNRRSQRHNSASCYFCFLLLRGSASANPASACVIAEEARRRDQVRTARSTAVFLGLVRVVAFSRDNGRKPALLLILGAPLLPLSHACFH